MFTIEVPHNADEVNIWFSSTLNGGSTEESWGISDVKIEYVSNTPAPQDKVTWKRSYFGANSLAKSNDA